MGRPPTPPQLKLVTGNPGKRKINHGLRLPPSAPPEPDWDELEVNAVAASKFWRWLIPRLDRVGMLADIDAVHLADFTRTSVRLTEAEHEVGENGFTLPTREGGAKSNPAVAAAAAYRSAFMRYCAEYGIGPATRGTMKPGKADDAEEAAARILDA